MGPAVPPIESIRAMVGKDHLWPMDDTWNYHAGGGAFKDVHVFTDALNARFGPATSVEDYALKAQLQTYEGVRAMYEAYSRNKYVSTGVIQWMLNNAWPSMIWHLYDFYLRPGGGYFGAKKSMEALHPVYGYDDRSIWIVSSQYVDAKGLKLTTKILNLDMSEKFSQQTALDAAADSTNKVLSLPDIDGLSPTYFLFYDWKMPVENWWDRTSTGFRPNQRLWIGKSRTGTPRQHRLTPTTPRLPNCPRSN